MNNKRVPYAEVDWSKRFDLRYVWDQQRNISGWTYVATVVGGGIPIRIETQACCWPSYTNTGGLLLGPLSQLEPVTRQFSIYDPTVVVIDGNPYELPEDVVVVYDPVWTNKVTP